MSESLPKLQPCPCGKTPARVCIEDTGQGGKWANVTGACCGEWAVEFRTNYHDYRSPECEKLAIDAWNEAPRADQSRCAEMEAKLQSPLQRDGVPTVYLLSLIHI